MNRRLFLPLVALALFAAPPAGAQQWAPTKSIRLLVGAPAGGSNDILGRAIGQRLSEVFGQPVVVDNRPGASQMLAADLMAKSPPDGTTLYISSSTYATTVALNPKQPFDPLNDVTGVALLGNGPLVLVVHPSVPAKNAKELIALARARPGQLNYTSSGVGGINHLGTEVFEAMAKIDMVHIPHKGMAPALTDLMAGQVQVLLISAASVEAQIQSKRLRAIGISTAKRSSFMPGLPTIAESGLPGYDVSLWWGIFAPVKTPRPAVERLNAEINRILATDEMKKRFADFGAETTPASAETFTAMFKREIAMWSKVVKDANIKAE
jgi:tripartite-type tricarboxylate transporter receptor subunit TctC